MLLNLAIGQRHHTAVGQLQNRVEQENLLHSPHVTHRDPSTVAPAASTVVAAAPDLNIRVARLEQVVDEIRAEVADLSAQLHASVFGAHAATQ